MIAQIVTQIIVAQFSFSIYQFFTSLIAFVVFVRLFEKFSNIFEYDKKNKLNEWKQTLTRCMNENHDWYFIDAFKIIYVEFRLIIEKRTFILMMSYKKNDVCILLNFSKYFRIFRYVCENFFEVENARTYFRNIFKQNFNNFIEYYQFFF